MLLTYSAIVYRKLTKYGTYMYVGGAIVALPGYRIYLYKMAE